MDAFILMIWNEVFKWISQPWKKDTLWLYLLLGALFNIIFILLFLCFFAQFIGQWAK